MPSQRTTSILDDIAPARWESLPQSEWSRRHRDSSLLSASMVPAILGHSKWETPFSLYQKLKGYWDASMVNGNPDPLRLRVGRFLEPLIAQEYGEQTGRSVVSPGETTVVYHQDFPWFSATPDRLVVDDAKGVGILEMKTVATMTDDAGEWQGGTPPLAVQIQLMAQLACFGGSVTWGSVAGMIGLGQDFVCADIAYDKELAALVMAEVVEFRNRLIEDNPPDPDGREPTSRLLNERFRDATPGSETILPFEANDLAREYYAAKTASEKAAEEYEAVKNRIRLLMGENEVGVCGLNRVKWTQIEKTGAVHFNTKDLSPKQIRDAMNALAKMKVASSMTEGSSYRRLSMPKVWK